MGTALRGTVVIIFQLLYSSSTVFSATPIVTWHGVGGTAAECNSLIDTIKLSLPDVHVLNVAVGPDPDMDHANSVLMRCVDQIDMICKQLLDDPLMARLQCCGNISRWSSHQRSGPALSCSSQESDHIRSSSPGRVRSTRLRGGHGILRAVRAGEGAAICRGL